MRVIFFGTPDFAVPSFKKIFTSKHEIVGIVTQPDKPKGRGQKLLSTPVKLFALENQLNPIFDPLDLKDKTFIQNLKKINADIFVIVAFRILPEVVFTLPPKGTINSHPSLLPKYRGAAPINWTIINGEKDTGVTIIKISKQIDAGNIILQEKIGIQEDETAGDLHGRLSQIGADLLVKSLDRLQEGEVKLTSQDEKKATPAPKLNKEMCHINFDQPVGKVKNWIHGLSPYPAGYSYLNGRNFKFYKSKVIDTSFSTSEPGTILKANDGKINISCNPGIIEILDLQIEGKKRLSSEEFLRGFFLKVGDKFE